VVAALAAAAIDAVVDCVCAGCDKSVIPGLISYSNGREAKAEAEQKERQNKSSVI
jgi:hypothetical protein